MDETMERGAVDETMDDQVDLDHGPWSSGRDHGGSGGRGGASGDVNHHGGAVGGWPPHQNRKPLGIRRPWRSRRPPEFRRPWGSRDMDGLPGYDRAGMDGLSDCLDGSWMASIAVVDTAALGEVCTAQTHKKVVATNRSTVERR